MRIRWLGVCVLACAALPALAGAGNNPGKSPAAAGPTSVAVAAPPPAAASVVDLETVVVSGRQPGPGLWTVSRDGRTLYVLGTLSPLPQRMEWMSADVEAVVARSQLVIRPPAVTLGSDIGMVRGMMLLPSLFRARRNPDGRSLREAVPADLYARWLPLKARYLPRNSKVEEWRPLFAAQELYEAAMRQSSLSQDNVVARVVDKAAKRNGVAVAAPKVGLTVTDPKAVIREFNGSTLADSECFSRTMARIESDLETMRARANAWAVGDIAALRALPQEDQYAACVRAVTETALARRIGASDLRARARTVWLEAAETALAAHPVSFATLPVADLLRPDGYLAALQAKGYEVAAP